MEKVCTAAHDLQEIPFSNLKKHHLASVNNVIVLADAAKLDVDGFVTIMMKLGRLLWITFFTTMI